MKQPARPTSERKSKSPKLVAHGDQNLHEAVYAATNGSQVPLAARRHPLVAEVLRQLARCGLPLGDKSLANEPVPLVIGVSGGPDSLALLLACVVISQRERNGLPRLVPIAAHVHHHLRESADEDAAAVRAICARFAVPVHVEDVRPGELPGNVAANARLLRYEALLKIARRNGAHHVAVAHHGDDQLETMLMALGRGTGIDGLAGMNWSRPLWDHVTLIRPLLASTKKDCQDLCKRAGIAWRDDPGNVDPERTRSRLRQDVVPVLLELWPDLPHRIAATAETLQAAKRALDWEIDQLFGASEVRQWERETLAEAPLAVIAAGLRRAALDAVPDIADDLNQRHLLQAAEAIRCGDQRPHRFHWPGGLQVKVTVRTVSLLSPEEAMSELAASMEEHVSVSDPLGGLARRPDGGGDGQA